MKLALIHRATIGGKQFDKGDDFGGIDLPDGVSLSQFVEAVRHGRAVPADDMDVMLDDSEPADPEADTVDEDAD